MHPVGDYGIRTIFPSGLNKGFGSKFCVGFRVRQETTEEGRRTRRPKRWQNNNKDDDDSSNILNDKNVFFLKQRE